MDAPPAGPVSFAHPVTDDGRPQTTVAPTLASIPARLERLPLTSYQNIIFAIIATAWLFDSLDLGALTFLLGSIKSSFALSAAQAGLLSSMSFVGMAFGAGLSGVLADRFGRSRVLQFSIILWGVGGLCCALAPTATTLGAGRILVGFGMGAEFPAALAILSEMTPAKHRGRYMAILEGFWPIGFVCTGLLALAILPHYGWRGVFIAEAIPAVFVLVVRQFVPESPRWLEDRGDHARAGATMTRIEASVRRAFGRELPPPSLAQSTPAGERRLSLMELWAPGYARRTMMLWLLWFFALLGFYGLTTWLGALLQQAGFAVTKSVYYTILISLAGIPGFFTAAYLIEAWGRKATLVTMLAGSAATAYLYGTASTQATLIVFGLLMQFCLFGMWSAVYAYTPELYPSRARATGVGCASAVGRVGSLIGPYAVGVILPVIGQGGVFSLGAGAFVIAALAVAVFGEETRGRALEEIAH